VEPLIGKGQRFVVTTRPSDVPLLEPTARAGRPAIGPAPGQLPLRRIFDALSRRRWLILAMMLLGGGLMTIIGLMLPPTYTATTHIVVSRPPDGPNGAPASSQAFDEVAIDTHLAVLSSGAHLRRVAAALSLAHEDEASEPGDAASWQHRIANDLGVAWAAITQPFRRAATGPSDDAAESALAQHLKRVVAISQERHSRVIAVVATDPDPKRAAEIANTVAQVYIADLTQRKREEAEQLVVWLAKRVPEMKQDVAHAEQELQAYRLLHGAAVDGTPDVTGQQIAQLARQLALARSDLATAQQRLGRFRDLRQSGASTAVLAEALGSTTLAELARREAARVVAGQALSPDQRQEAQRATGQAIDQAASQIEVESHILQAQAGSIEERLQSLKAAAGETASSLSGLRALERQAAAVTQLYDGLLSRQQQANEQVQLIQPDVSVVSQAWPPERPSSLHPAFLIPPGVMVFGLIGVMMAIGLDRLDHTIRSADEASEALAVPCLGVVPKLEPRQAKCIEDVLRRQPRSAYARAIRALLVAVLPRGVGPAASKVILISSTLAGEGKSTLARSLAVSAAHLRLRVLLIDLGEQGGGFAQQNGITERMGVTHADIVDVLSHGRPIAEAVEHIPELGVDYIPPPRPGGNLLHFLANPQDRHWVDRFRESYDFIVIDGPAAIDWLEASFLAHAVDQVLFVVRSAQTSSDMARNALRLVESDARLGDTRLYDVRLGDAALGLDRAPRTASVLTWSERRKCNLGNLDTG
jgi:uncharacterized protein involved in exopolysaccharide biosynthesis/Mrp family chromosome partitioning ATPase